MYFHLERYWAAFCKMCSTGWNENNIIIIVQKRKECFAKTNRSILQSSFQNVSLAENDLFFCFDCLERKSEFLTLTKQVKNESENEMKWDDERVVKRRRQRFRRQEVVKFLSSAMQTNKQPNY